MDEVFKTVEERIIALCQYIKNITGMKVIRGKTPFTPQFKVPFIAVMVVAWRPLPSDLSKWETPSDRPEGFVQVKRGLGQLEVNIQAFGNGSLQALKHLSCSIPSDLWELFEGQNECGLSERTELQDLSQTLEDANMEERGGFTLNLYMSAPEEFDVDYYNKVDVTTIVGDKHYEVTETVRARE